ncbi:hypothetical protein DW142_07650 [Mediterraneibacter gnavus]|uniref:Uncharacterized protein n=1 Tax=Mediterraneibacter gnavus TaxID=33038 RepID=A0A8B3BTR6_MEDGN|nr:hypothetical protein DW142_07650 [Mediterraneibacter gnavus]
MTHLLPSHLLIGSPLAVCQSCPTFGFSGAVEDTIMPESPSAPFCPCTPIITGVVLVDDPSV